MFGLEKLNLGEKLNFDDAYNTFLGLERKQQMAVSIGLVVVLLFLIYLPVSFVAALLGDKEEAYAAYLKKAQEIVALKTRYTERKGRFQKFEQSFSKLGSDSLRTVIYNLAEENDIEKTSLEMKSVNLSSNEQFSEVGSDVRIRQIELDQALNFIHKLETYDALPLTIKKVFLKADSNDRMMLKEVSFTVSTIKPNKGDSPKDDSPKDKGPDSAEEETDE